MVRALPLIAVILLVWPSQLRAQDFRVVAVDPGRWPALTLTAVLPAEDGDPAAYHLKLGPADRPLIAKEVTRLDPHEPVSILVALDTSYTLTPAHLRAVQEALNLFAENFVAGERIALLGFNNSIRLTTEFAGDQTTFMSDIKRLRLGGRKTELYRSLMRGIELLGRNEGGRHLLVVSDGHDEGADLTVDQVLRNAAESGVQISVIGLTGLPTDTAGKHLAVMKNLAEETGGVYLAADKAEETGSGLYNFLTQRRAVSAEEPERLFQLVFDLSPTPAPSEVLEAELNYASPNGLWVAEFPLSVPTGPDGGPGDSHLALAGDAPKSID